MMTKFYNAWRHQAITWTNVDLINEFHLWPILQNALKILTAKINLQNTHGKITSIGLFY